ncbi:hypothetical protein ACFQZ4_04645 [Catellatospora coxensis]|uniref:Uncharacterized protein n=1 Tax=Catellatospora coxensis TaxID=310354 RepID=A0A8J3P6U5_9ACTN|nr:hypothetical protein [Catellatospora coxensis]GIG06226.1 hypothetical protein Cco03nite_29260 [Catellatospora coxensis]
MTSPDATRDRAPKTPRWVKLSALALLVLAAAFVALHLTGNSPSHGAH